MFAKLVTRLTGKVLVDRDEIQKNMEIIAQKRAQEIVVQKQHVWQQKGLEAGRAEAHKGTQMQFGEFSEWFEFSSYSNKQEREIIAGLVKHEDWPVFKQNLRRQGLKFHHDASLIGDSKMMVLYHTVGNKIQSLADFYDHAGDPIEEEPEDDPNSGYEPQ
tara:strand:+ start:2960 stop:3439 length:480 start_codon:yes stop_codon:yes gene_type:complete